MNLYTTKWRTSSTTPRDPYPIFWKPDYHAPGFAFSGLGSV